MSVQTPVRKPSLHPRWCFSSKEKFAKYTFARRRPCKWTSQGGTSVCPRRVWSAPRRLGPPAMSLSWLGLEFAPGSSEEYEKLIDRLHILITQISLKTLGFPSLELEKTNQNKRKQSRTNTKKTEVRLEEECDGQAGGCGLGLACKDHFNLRTWAFEGPYYSGLRRMRYAVMMEPDSYTQMSAANGMSGAWVDNGHAGFPPNPPAISRWQRKDMTVLAKKELRNSPSKRKFIKKHPL